MFFSQSVAEVTEPGEDIPPLVQAVVDGSGDDGDLWELRPHGTNPLNRPSPRINKVKRKTAVPYHT